MGTQLCLPLDLGTEYSLRGWDRSWGPPCPHPSGTEGCLWGTAPDKAQPPAEGQSLACEITKRSAQR